MDDKDIRQIFQGHLLQDEYVSWSGQPETNVNFTNADIFIVPFSLIWGSITIFGEITSLLMYLNGTLSSIDTCLYIIPFLIVGLYLMFGRFLFKRWKKQRTYYAITNKRIITLTKMCGIHLREIDIEDIFDISKSVRSDGIGTLSFINKYSSSFIHNRWYLNTGIDFYNLFSPLAFFDINKANEVYKLLINARNNQII